jgi:hypothetical protein
MRITARLAGKVGTEDVAAMAAKYLSMEKMRVVALLRCSASINLGSEPFA